jgi:AmmeMemoRadiSam system protein B
MTLRKAVWAGQFYPAGEEKLRSMIRSFEVATQKKERAIGLMAPHAGYVYSGQVAGAVYSAVNIPDKAIILSTKHHASGKDLALWEKGHWETPLGASEVDAEMSRRLMKYCPAVEFDESAHLQEHSAEVQLPFLQYFNPAVKISVMGVHSENLRDLQKVGAGIAKAVKAEEGNVLIVASSDMSHYVPQNIAKEKDKIALDAVVALNEEKLFEVILRHGISMCGYMPTIALIAAGKELGARAGRLVLYATSGEASGDFDSVVGYAGVIIT